MNDMEGLGEGLKSVTSNSLVEYYIELSTRLISTCAEALFYSLLC
jgi:hypothetical protein